ncbi:MAG: PDZ domain-containing protein [Bryobacteraceae bacterium]
MALNLASHQPYIDAEVQGSNGKPIHASVEIDTGKVDPFSMNAAFARRNGLRTDAPGVLAMKGISLGGETQAWFTRGEWLRFADFSLKNPVIAMAEEDTNRAGQLGYGVLKRFTITFDYARSRAFFEANASLSQMFEFDHAGWILSAGGPDFSSLKVFMVIAGTPASAAGIRDGDEILTINGRPANAFSLDEAREYFEHAMGPQKLSIRREGAMLSVIVGCHPLV